ncbi:MAG: response regulator [Betaproteobacteria bacterium]|nr:response regulator [Betaproteobacteria bacterium]
MRLLLVEDDPMIGESIRRGLRLQNFAVDWARDGNAARLALDAAPYRLVVLDLGLPGEDGLSVLKGWRAKGRMVPVLIVTARDAVSERIEGLDAGADDYLVKPFALDELSARVRALLRRQAGRAEPLISMGPLSLDPRTHAVTYQGASVALSGREFALLQVLMEGQGAVLSRERLEECLYGWGDEVASNAVEVYIHHLRKKLAPHVIRSIRGVGYQIVPDDAVHP